MAQLLIGKRRQKRTKMVVPIRVWAKNANGVLESHLAHTLDVSDHGVKLGGFTGELTADQVIEIQYHHKRSRFRIVWVKTREGSTEKEIGAECSEPDKRIWGVEFPEVMDQFAGHPHSR
jgi:hypothetical protein